jgi:hypothetical protein
MSRITRIGGVSRQFLLAGTSLLFLLGTSLGHASEAAVLSPAHSAVRPYAIPAQDLASALLVFGRQSGLQISASSRLVQNHQAPALQGNFSAVEALRRLLAGSGLSWTLDAQGIRLEAPAQKAGRLELGNTLIQSHQTPPMGTSIVGRQQIEGLPAGNGDITSLLKINPNVQFDNSQLSSKTPGEISPANISINGARHWQNLFTVDGIGMNNDIDPGSTSNSLNEVPGRSQGLALDTDLLESIQVYDSNVPASFGGFSGGVIDAMTRKPSQELHGKLSVQVARSKWTEYHIDKDDPKFAEFEAGVGSSNQPEFDKLITRATLEGHLTDNFGLLANFSRKESTVPSRNFELAHTSDIAGQYHDQTRRIDNYFLKAAWQINENWELDLSLTHAPETYEGHVSNSFNSRYELKQGGDSVNARLQWNAPLAKIEQNLGWSRLENSRDSETNYMRTWRWSESKDWNLRKNINSTSSEGSHGDLEQQQETLAYKLKIDWNSFPSFGVEHSVQTGLELSRSTSYYERVAEYASNALTGTASTTWCDSNDPWCALGVTANDWPGQYINKYTLIEAGKIEFDTTAWAVFLQDEMRYKRLTLRPGVRVDADDYMDQTTIAPRFAADLDVFGDDQTHITAGANRYYGRNLAAYRLRDGVAAMQINYSRPTQTSPWVEGARVANNVKFDQLDIPYDDELVLGFSHIQWDTEFAFKYVNRKGRDQISQDWGSQIGQPSTDTSTLAANYSTFYNGGKSDSDVYTLTITPVREFTLWGTRNSGQLALDWTDVVSSSFSDYSQRTGLLWIDDPIIHYNGTFMRYSARPADNYNRPWTVRLSTLTQIPDWNLSWSNFLRYRDGYRRIALTSERADYNGEQVRVWADTIYSGAFTWDTRLAWELPTAKDQAVFINLDVTNLLDEVIVSSADNDDIPTYEIGRQFMIEVGYKF